MTSHLKNSYTKVSSSYLPLKISALALTVLALSGCFGGTAAQQLARSILMQGADKATAAAIDADNRKQAYAANHIDIQNTEMDEYQIAFLRAGFETIKPQIEPLPQAGTTAQIEPLPEPATETEPTANLMQINKLVNVEVWSLLIGDEKQRLLEKERLQGSMLIPPKEEWSRWQIAVGAADNNQRSSKNKESLIFLIPPDIGKLRSGGKALVEVQTNGELSIARYALN